MSLYNSHPTSPNEYFTPPTSPILDDVFPLQTDIVLDLDDHTDSLTVLEKIYLYSRSAAYYHRIFIVHKLSIFLDHVSPQEAVEYVLPLLQGLAMDQDDSVKEALAEVLVPVIWWFFSHCQLIPEELTKEEMYASSSSTVTVSVQAFTPIIGTLLLDQNKRVGILTRDALVSFLSKMNKVDQILLGVKENYTTPRPCDQPDDDPHILSTVRLFRNRERALFRNEILQQIILGLGQLDDDDDVRHDPSPQPSQSTDWSNPYFPPVFTPVFLPSPVHSPSHRNSPLFDYSPAVEFPPGAISPAHSPARSESIGKSAVDNNIDPLDYYEDQGTLGRIACMSLIAAVTAGGPLDEDTLRSFLDEVERVVHDPYFKVRQAASFALGALAKEIPGELIPRLMPLFDLLRWDTVWVVRHSALFALPAILGRLSSAQRRTVALETVVALSADKNATVRCGVLECLGEVLYTFVNDDAGPPDQLVQLFLGRQEDKVVRTGQKPSYTTLHSALASLNMRLQNHVTPLESFYTLGKRPLICAFNFPAVVLALGGDRWPMLRENYLDLVKNPNLNVSRTLAASVGEIAKIIGTEKARRDLVNVWRGFLRSAEADVRMKAMEGLLDLMTVVMGEEEVRFGLDMVGTVRTTWQEDLFKSWRERESVQKKLISWFSLVWARVDVEVVVGIFRDLLVKGLEDAAANVREAAIANIPAIWALCSGRAEILEDFHSGIKQLACSPVSKKRMTFVACQQMLVSSAGNTLDDATLQIFSTLMNDRIEGVRIGVARFVALVYRNLLRDAASVPGALLELLERLSRDDSAEVRSFAVRATLEESAKRPGTPPPEDKRGREKLEQVGLFSRPPIHGKREAAESVPPAGNSEEVFKIIEGETMTTETTNALSSVQGDVDMDAAYVYHRSSYAFELGGTA